MPRNKSGLRRVVICGVALCQNILSLQCVGENNNMKIFAKGVGNTAAQNDRDGSIFIQ